MVGKSPCKRGKVSDLARACCYLRPPGMLSCWTKSEGPCLGEAGESKRFLKDGRQGSRLERAAKAWSNYTGKIVLNLQILTLLVISCLNSNEINLFSKNSTVQHRPPAQMHTSFSEKVQTLNYDRQFKKRFHLRCEIYSVESKREHFGIRFDLIRELSLL